MGKQNNITSATHTHKHTPHAQTYALTPQRTQQQQHQQQLMLLVNTEMNGIRTDFKTKQKQNKNENNFIITIS